MADYEVSGDITVKEKSGCSDTFMGILFFIFVIVPIVGIVTMCGGGDNSSSSGSNNNVQVNNGGYVGGDVDSTGVIVETVPSVVGLESLKQFDYQGQASIYHSYSTDDSYGNSYNNCYVLSLWSRYCYDETNNNDTPRYTAWIEFATGGKYNYFTATVFCDENMNNDQTIEFFIYADEVLVYSSGVLNNKTKAFDINVCINNCDVLRIESSTPDKGEDALVLYAPSKVIMINPKVNN